MPRIIAPATPEFAGYTGVHPIAKGGFGASTEAGIKANLGTIDKTDTSAGGIVKIGEDGVAQGMQDVTVIADFTTIFGPQYFEYTEPTKYEITSYTPFKSYSAFIKELPEVEVIIQDEYLFIPAGIELDTITLVVNGREVELTRIPSGISVPTIKVNGFRDTTYDYLQVVASEFKSEYGKEAGSIQVQVSTTSGFTNIIKDQTVASLQAVDGVVMELPKGTAYYVRVRMSDSDGRWSDWSAASSVTAASLPNNIATPTLSAKGYLDSDQIEITSTASKMLSRSGMTHASSDWQISSNSGFTALVANVATSTTSLRSIVSTFASTAEVFYARTRQRNSAGQTSAWSNVVTINKSEMFPSIPYIFSGRMVSGTMDPIDGTRSMSSDYEANTVAININYDGTKSKYAIYKRDKDTWKIIQYIETLDYSVDSVNTDHGSIFSYDGSYFVIGNATEREYGAVRIYKFVNGQYQFVGKVVNPESVKLTYFGTISKISNDGEFLIIGAFRHTSNTGKAYFYKFENGVYVLKQTLSETEVKVQERYGHNFMLSEDKMFLVVNAMQTVTDGGTLYIYKYNGSTWVKLSKLTGKSINANIGGFALGVNGTKDLSKLYLSSRRDLVGGVANGSSLHEFTKNGETWTYTATINPPIHKPSMEFGASTTVARNGNRLYVPYSSITTYEGSLHVYDRDGTSWKLVETIKSPKPEIGDVFARSQIVTKDEEFLLVNCANVNGNIPGILIYKRQTEKYQRSKTVYPDNIANNIQLGISASVSDDGKYAAVGAINETVNSIMSGSVHIYKFVNGEWVKETVLVPADAARDDQFGYSCKFNSDGTRIAIASRLDDDKGNNSGSVYVYSRSGSVWTQEAKLVVNNGAAGEQNFCVRMDSSGSTIVVGVPYHNNGSTASAGRAVIYTRTGTTWTQSAALTSPRTTYPGLFGMQVDISSDGAIIAVGEASVSHTNTLPGKVYVYRKVTSTQWNLEATLSESVEVTNHNFGFSVSISGDNKYIVVSAVHAHDKQYRAGAVEIFEYKTGSWTFLQRLLPEVVAAYSYYGTRVAISGDGKSLFVGSDGASYQGYKTGLVYKYKLENNLWVFDRLVISPLNPNGGSYGFPVVCSKDARVLIVGQRVMPYNSYTAVGTAHIFY